MQRRRVLCVHGTRSDEPLLPPGGTNGSIGEGRAIGAMAFLRPRVADVRVTATQDGSASAPAWRLANGDGIRFLITLVIMSAPMTNAVGLKRLA
jgi:hypothetical protein